MVIDYKILTHEQLMTEKAHLIIKLNAQIAINDFKEAQITKSELVELIAIEKLKITQTKKENEIMKEIDSKANGLQERPEVQPIEEGVVVPQKEKYLTGLVNGV